MSGLMRRLTRRRAADPHGTSPPAEAARGPDGAPTPAPPEPGGERSLLADPAAADQPTPVTDQPGGERSLLADPAAADQPTPAADQPTEQLPVSTAASRGRDLPAGLDQEALEARIDSSARRSRVRRRIEFLRAAREVLLRDLGGFVFELHRTAPGVEREGHRRLREAKLSRLAAVEAELHELELRIGDRRRRVVVREPGLGGECPRCSELFGSDANYCAHCGEPLTSRARKARAAAAERARPEADSADAKPAAADASVVPADAAAPESSAAQPEAGPGTDAELPGRAELAGDAERRGAGAERPGGAGAGLPGGTGEELSGEPAEELSGEPAEELRGDAGAELPRGAAEDVPAGEDAKTTTELAPGDYAKSPAEPDTEGSGPSPDEASDRASGEAPESADPRGSEGNGRAVSHDDSASYLAERRR